MCGWWGGLPVWSLDGKGWCVSRMVVKLTHVVGVSGYGVGTGGGAGSVVHYGDVSRRSQTTGGPGRGPRRVSPFSQSP